MVVMLGLGLLVLVVPPVSSLFCHPGLGPLLMIVVLFGVGALRRVYFEAIPEPVVPLRLAALPFLVEVCYVFVAGVWEVELLAVRVLAGCIGLAMVMKLMFVQLC